MDRLTESVVTIVVAIIGLATLAVLVSKNANTAGVIGAGGRALGGLIGVAVSPIAGGGNNLAMSNPNGGYF